MVESLIIRNIISNESKQFDMSEANYLIYEGAIDWGNVDVTHNTFQFPEQIGQYVSSTVLGSRDISINGWIIGDTEEEIKLKKVELSKFFNPFDEMEIIVGNYSIFGKPSANVQYGKTLAENSVVAVKFLLQIFCPQPLFLLSNAISVDVAETIGAFGFPLILKPEGIIMGYRKKSLFTDITNDGATSVGMIITFEASGTVNNPEFMDVNTHKRIRINKVLTAGEVVIINTSIGERSVTGIVNGNEINYFKYFDYDNEWLQIPNGLSTFTYRTYDSSGEQDESYKKMSVNVKYKTAIYNLEGE